MPAALNCTHCVTENTWVQFKAAGKNYIIGGIYRHPNGNVAHFTTDLNNSLDRLDRDVTCILAGDTNIDLMKYEQQETFNYYTTLASKDFLPYIVTPTRITDYTATAIDHIFMKLPRKELDSYISSGNLFTDITDHLPNFIIIKSQRKDKVSDQRPFVRIFSERNIDSFKSELRNSDWENILSNNDIDIACREFYAHILSSYNACFPLKRL